MSEIPPVDPMPPAPPPPPLGPEGLPWEDANAGLGSLIPTIGQFVAHPSRSFARMSLTVDLVRPLAYCVTFVLMGAVVSRLWGMLFFDSIVGVAREFVPPQLHHLLVKPTVVWLAVEIVIAPLLGLIVLFIWSAFVHLVLLLLGGAGSGFAATLRVLCYARTADVAVTVPIVGGLIGFVWCRVLEIIGLSQAHRTDGWKAALAVLVPLALCCFCIVGGVIASGAAIAQALQQMK